MAIPLYVPIGIGPVTRNTSSTSAQLNNSTGGRGNLNNSRHLNYTNSPSSVFSENRINTVHNNLSFLTQLIMELVQVYERYNGETVRLNPNPQSQQPAQGKVYLLWFYQCLR